MKNRLLYSTLLILSVAFSSCSNWLDVSPKAEKPSGDMFEKASGFHDALMACYTKMSDDKIYGKQMLIDNIEHMAQHWTRGTSEYDALAVANFEYEKENVESFVKDVYGSLYNVIAQANLVNVNIQTKGNVINDPELRNALEGESLAIRAFCHFDILRMFGQMPKNSTKTVSLPYAEKVTIENMPYYSYSEFTKKIEADLIKAEALLKDSDPVLNYTLAELNDVAKLAYTGSPYLTYRRYRLNYWAVKALQARFYLYINQPAKAKEAAMSVINAKKSDGTKLFELAGDGDFNAENYTLPSETLFSLSASKINEIGNNLIADASGVPYVYINNESLTDLFLGRAIGSNNRLKNLWTKTRHSMGFELNVIRKYVSAKDPLNKPEDDVLLFSRQVIPMLRLSEMYLIAMETSELAESNPLYIEYMLKRAEQVPAFETKEELNVEILKEYRREFWAEGQMFFTYKRLGTTKMLWKQRDILESDYVVPIPKTEIVNKK